MAAHHTLTMGILASSTSPFPKWLPTAPSGDRPMIYADFVNGHYWGGGTAVLTVDQLFVQNADWGDYNSSSITPGSGLDVRSAVGSPVVNHAYLDNLLSGCTVFLSAATSTLTGTQDYAFEADVVNLPSFTGDAYGTCLYGDVGFDALGAGFGALNNNNGSGGLINFTSPQALAYTVYTDRTTGSFCGQPNFTTAVGPPAGTPTDIGIKGNGPRVGYITAFAVYAPQPDLDLPTLSTP